MDAPEKIYIHPDIGVESFCVLGYIRQQTTKVLNTPVLTLL